MALITFASDLPSLALRAGEEDYFSTDRFRYAMMWNAAEILFKPFSTLTEFEDFPEGRVWGEKCDVQWRARDGRFHLVLIAADGEPVPEIFVLENRKQLSKPPAMHEVFLWGEYDDKEQRWLEIKVPRLFEYAPFLAKPATRGSRVRLAVYEYEIAESRKLWELGQQVEVPFISRVYRYGKVFGEGESL